MYFKKALYNFLSVITQLITQKFKSKFCYTTKSYQQMFSFSVNISTCHLSGHFNVAYSLDCHSKANFSF